MVHLNLTSHIISIGLLLNLWVLGPLIQSIDEFELVCTGNLGHFPGYIIRHQLLALIISIHLILHKLIWTRLLVRYFILNKGLSDIAFVVNVSSGYLLPVVEELLLVHPLVLLIASRLVIGVLLIHHLLLCHGHTGVIVLLLLVPVIVELLLLHFSLNIYIWLIMVFYVYVKLLFCLLVRVKLLIKLSIVSLWWISFWLLFYLFYRLTFLTTFNYNVIMFNHFNRELLSLAGICLL